MSVDRKIDFAAKHIKAKEGHSWSLKGRDWVKEQFWVPADGYKLWNTDQKEVCEDCKDVAGSIIESFESNPTRTPEHASTGCPGLSAEPIIVTILNLNRQDGKTFNSMAYAVSTAFLEVGKSFGLLTASEDQAETLFRENYLEAIRADPALEKLCDHRRMRFDVPRRNSRFEVMSTSHRSVTGRGRTHILIDEARDIPARVVAALIPAVFAQAGVECPRGHVKLGMDEIGPTDQGNCSVCGDALRTWYARIIITSSSGVVEGGENDWLPELIDLLNRTPHPNYHVFQSETPLNPRKSEKIVHAIGDVFSQLPSMRDYMAAEAGNRWTKKGEDFISEFELKRCINPNVGASHGTMDRCVGFLDTSISQDKTSLVILAEDSRISTEPWEYVYTARMDVWDPHVLEGGIINEKAIMAHLEEILPLFPNLITLPVDTRGIRWGNEVVMWGKRQGGVLSKLTGWNKLDHEEQAGFGILESRILQVSIQLPPNEDMIKEFKGLTFKTQGNKRKVADRNRRMSHKDITSALAICCYLAHVQKVEGARTSLKDLKLNKTVESTRTRLSPRIGKVWY